MPKKNQRERGMDYIETLKSSFVSVTRNPALAMPPLIGISLLMAVVLIIVVEATFFIFVLKSFGFLGILMMVFLGIIDVLLLIMVSSFTRATLISMFSDVAIGKQISLERSIGFGTENMFRYMKIIVLRAAIILIPLLAIGSVFFLMLRISNVVAVIVGAIIGAILTIAYFTLATLALFFLDPMFASGTKRPSLDIIKDAVMILKKNPRHLFLSWGVVIVISSLVGIAMSILSFPANLLSSAAETVPGLIPASIIVSMILGVIQLIVSFAVSFSISVFTFRAFYHLCPIPKKFLNPKARR